MGLPVVNGSTVLSNGTFGPQPWGDASCETGLPNGWVDEMGRQLILPPRVHVLPSVPQTRGLHTIMRDRDTDQDSFVFYSERLMRPLCEYAMNLLPHMVMETPQGIPYRGRQLAAGTQVCGVSILRAGEALEPALCAVCKDVRLGKILIQTNPDTCEPELHYIRLPSDIKVGAFDSSKAFRISLCLPLCSMIFEVDHVDEREENQCVLFVSPPALHP
ncbi:unnamed protein product [Echinostoma caproni]|uniref:CABIT domain-containing protein n=1 Tax=Echinostoma caproni TaxID=27848 RepID=A0A183A0Q6_9TREM|nr:unnamed protein product [Echinostoma caproni]